MAILLSEFAAKIIVGNVNDTLRVLRGSLGQRYRKYDDQQDPNWDNLTRVLLKLALMFYKPKNLSLENVLSADRVEGAIRDPAIRALVLSSVTNALPQADLDALNAYSVDVYRETIEGWDPKIDVSQYITRPGRPVQD